MGTSNFYNVNANKIFIVTDDNQEISTVLEDMLPKLYITKTLKTAHELRSYPSISIGEIDEQFEFLGISFTVTIEIYERIGYYENSNLDWEIVITHSEEGNFTADNVKDVIDDISTYGSTYYGINKGLWSIHRHRLQNKLDKIYNDLIREVEEAFEKVTEPYKCIAIASNGEAFYERA